VAWVSKILIAAALALAASGLSACGSDDSSGADVDASTTPTVAEESQTGSASFDTEGYKKILSFGREAGPAEVEAAEAVVAAYLRARAELDGEAACSHIGRLSVRLLSNTPPDLEECAEGFVATASEIPAPERASTMTDGLASLRVEGDRAYALYHGAKGVDYFIPMVKQGGEWKLAKLSFGVFP
jgi:hypothetical protein